MNGERKIRWIIWIWIHTNSQNFYNALLILTHTHFLYNSNSNLSHTQHLSFLYTLCQLTLPTFKFWIRIQPLGSPSHHSHIHTTYYLQFIIWVISNFNLTKGSPLPPLPTHTHLTSSARKSYSLFPWHILFYLTMPTHLT